MAKVSIWKQDGLYHLTVGGRSMGLARELEMLLANASGVAVPGDYYLHAAEVIEPFIGEDEDGQVKTWEPL